MAEGNNPETPTKKESAPEAEAVDAVKAGAASEAAADGEGESAGEAKKTYRKKKGQKTVNVGNVYVQSTFNNTMISVTDLSGNVISWDSAGAQGFKGSRKSTPFAAQVAAESAIRKAQEFGLRNVSVYIKGPGSGREAALRALAATGMRVSLIKDVTPIPHNGCRPSKRRRV